MSTRSEYLIGAVRAAGGIIRREGDMIELAAARPLPPALVARIREAKAALLAILAEAAGDWRSRHREALVYWAALHPADEAEKIAWGEMQWRWHRLHGARASEWRCAGCGEPIGGFASLTLGDGNRVHLDRLNCLLLFGERWRCEASAGLQALGLDPPLGGAGGTRPMLSGRALRSTRRGSGC
jgi:hypothetical protein